MNLPLHVRNLSITPSDSSAGLERPPLRWMAARSANAWIGGPLAGHTRSAPSE